MTASNLAPKQILLSGNPVAHEATAAGAITPGMLIATDNTGKVVAHGTAGGIGSKMVAREMELTGKGYDTDYASGDRVPYYVGRSGDRFWMVLAASQTIAIGDYLESNGAGALRATTHATDTAAHAAAWPLFKAIQAVTTTGAVGRIKVECL